MIYDIGKKTLRVYDKKFERHRIKLFVVIFTPTIKSSKQISNQ